MATITKAEGEFAVDVAKRYPRDVVKALNGCRSLVLRTYQSASQCHYAMPRAGKSIEGPSVRFAETLASQWGNLRVAARVIEVGQTEVVCQGACHDLESNVGFSSEVRRPIMYSAKGERAGRRFGDDQIVLTANAGCSIARRNAIFVVVPRATWEEIYQEALAVIRQVTPESKARAFQWFAAKMNARSEDELARSEQAVCRALHVSRAKDVGPDEMQLLMGWKNAVEEGARLEELLEEAEVSSHAVTMAPPAVIEEKLRNPEAGRMATGGIVDVGEQAPRRGPGRPRKVQQEAPPAQQPVQEPEPQAPPAPAPEQAPAPEERQPGDEDPDDQQETIIPMPAKPAPGSPWERWTQLLRALPPVSMRQAIRASGLSYLTPQSPPDAILRACAEAELLLKGGVR